MKVIVGLAFAGVILGAVPQVMWEQVFDRGGIEKAHTLGLASSAEIYLSGENNEQGDKDVWTLKLNKASDVIWERWFDTNFDDAGYDLAVAFDASLTVACLQNLEATPKAFVISYDSQGDLLWQTNVFVNQTNLPPVITSFTPDTHYVSVCGAFSNGQASVVVVMLDGDGQQKEEESFNAYTTSCPTGIVVSHDGYVLRSASPSSCRLFWNDLDLSNFQVDIYDEGENERGFCLEVDSGNFVFLGGELFQSSKRCMMLQKWESRGNIAWQPAKRYDLGADEYCRDIKLDAISDCYLAGWQVRGTEEDAALVKTDSAGRMLWSWVYEMEGDQEIEGIEVDEDGYIYLAGSHHNGENWDMLVMQVRQPLEVSGFLDDGTDQSDLTDVPILITGDTTLEIMTDAEAKYSVELYNGGTYTVTPQLGGWVFDPPSVTYDPLAHRELDAYFWGEWTGVVENVISSYPSWELISSCGSQITLCYSNYPDGFAADVFDASGRKVDKLESAGVSGIITWGACYGSGVYFIRAAGDQTPETKRIVLIP